MAAHLGLTPDRVRLYVVHGERFEPGPPSVEVAAGVGAAAERILRDELGGAAPAAGNGSEDFV